MPFYRTAARVTQLTRAHGVSQKNVMGAFHEAPLRQLEFLLHEVAHWLVLGNPIEKVPCRLSAKIESAFSRIPAVSADSLEIDTALVTYLAGYRLGLWSDPSPIVTSCRRNLKGIAALGPDDVILKKLRQRWADSPRTYVGLADSLAFWFRPSAKLLPTTDVKFGV